MNIVLKIHESMIPDWFDIIMWGHEHKSEIDPVESSHGYYITQPGSTVATSLIEGEACRKHCGVLDIKGTQFRLDPLPMKKVRPFKMEEFMLNECVDLDNIDPNDPDINNIISNILTTKINEMLLDISNEYNLKNDFCNMNGRDIHGKILPLIRLRVFRGDYQAINVQRFGSQFM